MLSFLVGLGVGLFLGEYYSVEVSALKTKVAAFVAQVRAKF